MNGPASSDRIVVRGVYEIPEAARDAFASGYSDLLEQIGRDVLTGTFDDYDSSIFPKPEDLRAFEERSRAAARCIDERDDESTRGGRFSFRLELAASLFREPSFGFQRLVHLLASDLFERRVSGASLKPRIIDIDLSPLQGVYEVAYRSGGKSHSVKEIKNAFALEPDQPLLAFSLKPRSCLLPAEYRHMASEAFRGGCDIVELDTRDLDLSSGRLALLGDLTKDAFAHSKERVCRFSANVSGPVRVAAPVLKRLDDLHSGQPGPWVVKIDGNLDGLSTIQAIRSGELGLRQQPIITCYPVLKYALQPSLGPKAFVKMLAMSGVDIVYPGQSPSFKRDDRRIDTNAVSAAQAHYDSMDLGGYPMLSVAGGTFVNSVHATMSVLGHDIAFFVGGGIALSKKGVRKGAESYAKAIDLARRDLFRGEKIRGFLEDYLALIEPFVAGKVPPQYDIVEPRELKNLGRLHKSTNLT